MYIAQSAPTAMDNLSLMSCSEDRPAVPAIRANGTICPASLSDSDLQTFFECGTNPDCILIVQQ